MGKLVAEVCMLREGVCMLARMVAWHARGRAGGSVLCDRTLEKLSVNIPAGKWEVGTLSSPLTHSLPCLVASTSQHCLCRSQLAFGVMFSFVAGMMVYISIRELLPTALRYDPKDSCATACAFWGMAVMAASLLLFKAKE